MNKLNKILEEENSQMTKIDYVIIGSIIIIYAILSFINLGVINSPQTFYNSKQNTDLIFELKEDTLIDNIMIYSGEELENLKILISKDNNSYHEIFSNNSVSTFEWNKIDIKKEIKYIKLNFEKNSQIGEIGIFNSKNNKVSFNILANNKDVAYLIDEYKSIPETPSYLNSTYFDEIYFARTTYDYKNNLNTYEWTHPPLGKMIQALPVMLFNNFSPFYYRLMGNIAGIIMIYIMYLFGKLLFKKRKWAIFASLLLFFETSHFSHTRMGTSDSFLILFIMISIYYMVKYLKSDSKSMKLLLLSGLFFGMAVSVKWSAFTGGLVLAIIYFIDIFKNHRSFLKSCLKGTLSFIIIPLILYTSIYFIYPKNRVNYTDTISNIVSQNIEMYDYHHNVNEDHPFSSKFYTWPISYKPVWYYVNYYENNKRGTISGVGNIIIWWLSVLIIPYVIYKCIKKDKIFIFLSITILSLFLPYIVIGRVMFLYHFYPTVPFIILLVTAFFKSIEKHKNSKIITNIYMLLVITFFILYYPVVSGMPTSNNYLDNLKILKTWIF